MQLLKFLLGNAYAFCSFVDGDGGAPGGGAGAGGTPPAGTPPAGTPPAGGTSTAFQIPAEFANEPWAAKVKTTDDLWKLNANAQSLLGRQGIKLPAPTATPEEKLAWRKDVARQHFEVPGKPEEYQFEAIEGVTRAPEREKAAREIFHKLDIPAPAAKELVKWYEANQAAEKAAFAEQNKVLDQEFDALSKTLWGDQAPQVIERLGELLADEVPESLRGVIEKLPGGALLALGTLVDNVNQKYTKQSKFIQNLGKMPVNTQTISLGETMDELSSAQRTLMMDKGFNDPFAPNHGDLQKVNNQIREKMMLLSKK